MKTYFHPAQLEHHPRSYLSRGKLREPQEVPDRARQILTAVKDLGFPVVEPPDLGMAPLLAVHTAEYLDFLRTAQARWKQANPDWGDEVMSNIYVREGNARRSILEAAGYHLADGSCPVGERTWHSAYWSAQSAAAAAADVVAGERQVYALCRPPGHHARLDAAGGFCYVNNAAVAAEVLRKRFGKVTVLDTDTHHGQGVQEIFYDRADVQYISIHGDPINFYPVVAGFADERGTGAGQGYNLNLPMPLGSPEQAFFDRLDTAVQAVRDYKAEALVLALGFDIYKDDPLTAVAVSTEGFERLGRAIAGLNLPTVIVQEGGYHLASLQANVRSFFGGL